MKIKIVLQIIFLLVITACHNNKNSDKQNNDFTNGKLKNNQTSKYHIRIDSLIIPTEIGDTIRFSKKEINQIIDNHPEFFDESTRSPDFTYHKFVNEVDFSSEAGQDVYYVLYAHFLKHKNGEEKYAKQRTKLINIYLKINSLFSNLQHGGPYFGHQSFRILGYAEYSIFIMPKDEELVEKTYKIDKQKSLYIKSLRQLIDDENEIDLNTIEKDKPFRVKKLNKIIDDLDILITDLFYLRKAQEFQYINYEYY